MSSAEPYSSLASYGATRDLLAAFGIELKKTLGQNFLVNDGVIGRILELAAIAHDIACPICREKYGNTNGKYQELEGGPLARTFYQDYGLSNEELDRIVYLVSHHHTYTGVDGMDYQILLEADFLVNADESAMKEDAIRAFRDKVFRTKTGLALLQDLFPVEQ